MEKLIKRACQLLRNGHPLVLATIIRHSGSTPRGAGSKMIVCENSDIIGTIGGGGVEAGVIRCATGLIGSGSAFLQHFNFNSTAAAGSMGMICGGEMDVLLEGLDPSDSETVEIFSALCSQLETGEKGLLLKAFSTSPDVPEAYHSGLVSESQTIPGDLFSKKIPLESVALEKLKETAFSQRLPALHFLDDLIVVADPIFSSDCTYIFGAGHVSQKLAAVLDMVDFRTAIIDDRAEFANRDLFPAADTIFIPEHFTDAFSHISISRRDALVIVTRGHAHDQIVLDQALKTDAGYIGMIGSRKKRDAIYQNLFMRGVSRDALGRVHCPIGINIGARTPEEIAVCIAAQLISYRAGML